jgi:hypothetical protein
MVGAGPSLGSGEADAAENRMGDCACVNSCLSPDELKDSDQSRYRHDPSRQTRDDVDLIGQEAWGALTVVKIALD